MSALSEQNNKAAIIAANVDTSLNCNTCNQVRMEKVLVMQKQLADGTYDLEERLNVALDRLLENFVA